MSDQNALWISEADVVSVMDVPGAIDALERGLRAEAEGQAQNMLKTHVAWSDGATLHAIGATFPREGFAGTKTWAHTKGGASPLLVLYDSENGGLKAIIEAFALGQMRTAAASGLATRLLAAEDANEFAIIGTGKQAMTQVAAVMAVRPIEHIRVYGRNEERCSKFAARIKKQFDINAIQAPTIAQALAGAGIITAVTRAAEPIISAQMITKGAHINAVGAIVPTRAEIGQDVLARCGQIVVDSVPQAQKLSRELIEFLGPPEREEWKRVSPLSSLVAAGHTRQANEDVTLFKSLGMGISDLSLGIEIYRSALARGLGHSLPRPQPIGPALRPSNK